MKCVVMSVSNFWPKSHRGGVSVFQQYKNWRFSDNSTGEWQAKTNATARATGRVQPSFWMGRSFTPNSPARVAVLEPDSLETQKAKDAKTLANCLVLRMFGVAFGRRSLCRSA
jgi:hypothetical protein